MRTSFFLKSLHIQNFATFKNQNIFFRKGFNVIVGETGSGKSLVLDALEIILGGRTDKRIVRKDTEYSLIEATFTCSDHSIKSYLEKEGYPTDNNELVIKRLIYKNGVSKTYVNHLSCQVGFLASFSKRYIDIVGQFENQKLLSENYQLNLVDHFSKNRELLGEYQTLLFKYKDLKNQLIEIERSKSSREQRLDYLLYQLQEIEKLSPSSQDEFDLVKKKEMIINLEKNQKISHQFQNIFNGTESNSGLLSLLKMASSLFIKNPELFQDQLSELSEIEDRINNIKESIDHKLSFDLDSESLENVIERLDQYQKLKKKFGGSVESLLQSQIEFLKEKKILEELDISGLDFSDKISKLETQLFSIAERMHKVRQAQSLLLSKGLTEKIRQLKMNGATLKIETEKLSSLNEYGLTRTYFMAETNPGEGFHRIKDIASGGELSRILLAIRQILSSYDSISIFLFDEIDTGIGGDTANCIGKALEEVARNGQVIAITHLPQIAQFAESLILVNKDTHQDNNRTESFVTLVSGQQIKSEVKAMIQLS